LAITAKLEIPRADVYAVEIDQKALDIANKNAVSLNADVHFYKGNLLEPLPSTFLYHGSPLAIYTDNPQASVRSDKRNETIVKFRIYCDYFSWLVNHDPLKMISIVLIASLLAIKNVSLRFMWRLKARIKFFK
jgi:16S rRNA G966 N2-methylase RsmD